MALPKTQPVSSDGVQVFYSYTILANSRPVGTLQSISASQSLSLTRIREVALNIGAVATDIVPGAFDCSLSIDQVKIYKRNLLEAVSGLVGVRLASLHQFLSTIDIVEISEEPGGGFRDFVIYRRCMISDWGRTITTGTTYVIENMTVECSWVTGKRQEILQVA